MARKNKPQVKAVNFTFESPAAENVSVAGDFNGWDSDRTQLRRGKNNVWQGGIKLRSGRYEYKFFVDGNWTIDPKNNNRVGNSFGSENSVLDI